VVEPWLTEWPSLGRSGFPADIANAAIVPKDENENSRRTHREQTEDLPQIRSTNDAGN
jgi:hypothetical protein